MINPKIKEICESIGQFYLQKNDGDYIATRHEIKEVDFTKVEWNEDEGKITLEVDRPGLIIGKRGENLYQLVKHLETDVAAKYVCIEEARDNLNDYIIPHAPFVD